MKEETIIQILNSLTTVGEKSLDDLIEYYGHHMFNDLIAMVFFEIFIIFIFFKNFSDSSNFFPLQYIYKTENEKNGFHADREATRR